MKNLENSWKILKNLEKVIKIINKTWIYSFKKEAENNVSIEILLKQFGTAMPVSMEQKGLDTYRM